MAWSVCRTLHRVLWSSEDALASRLFHQLFSLYPLHQLLSSSIQLGLLVPPSERDLLMLPPSSSLSFVSLRQPIAEKPVDAARSAFLQLAAKGMTSAAASTAASSSSALRRALPSVLCTPLTTSRLVGGVDGDRYGLHALWWGCAETASPTQLQAMLEFTVVAMYELLLGHRDADEEDAEDDAVQPRVSTHAHMATLTLSSFSTSFCIVLQLAQLLLCRLQQTSSSKTRQSATFTATALSAYHRVVLLYSHVLQLHILAAHQRPPPSLWRVLDSPAAPAAVTEEPPRRPKRERQLPGDTTLHPFADLR